MVSLLGISQKNEEMRAKRSDVGPPRANNCLNYWRPPGVAKILMQWWWEDGFILGISIRPSNGRNSARNLYKTSGRNSSPP